MNFTMVIADDEPLVLKSLEILILKNFPNIHIVGLAENGVELKELLERFNPELAIADIRMPGLSGLEVIELMRNKGCKTHFVINTAFNDFEYVKKALDMKTDGYILKPGKQNEKIKVISELCKIIETEREKDNRQNSMDSALQLVNPYLGSEILMSVFSGICDEEQFKVYLDINNLSFYGGCIATFLFKNSKQIGNRELNEEFGKVLGNVCNFILTVTSKGIIVLLFAQEDLYINSQSERLAEIISHSLKKLMGTECLYGVGSVYPSFSDMSRSYRESISKIGNAQKRLLTDNVYKGVDYVEEAKHYINNNFIHDISLMDCAESVGISPYYLSHIFKEKTGITFVEYLTTVRIEHAKELCHNQSLTIRDISTRCGYINTTYFCKVFKRSIGQTIGAYRQELMRIK